MRECSRETGVRRAAPEKVEALEEAKMGWSVRVMEISRLGLKAVGLNIILM
jgi:hypothetical protein